MPLITWLCAEFMMNCRRTMELIITSKHMRESAVRSNALQLIAHKVIGELITIRARSSQLNTKKRKDMWTLCAHLK